MQGTIDREVLLNASSNLLFSQGINSLTIQSLAKEANCSLQPIYSNFESIEEIKDHTLAFIFANLSSKLAQAIHTAEIDKLWAFHTALFKALLKAPGLAVTIASNYKQVAYLIRKNNNELIKSFNLGEQEFGRKIILNNVLTQGWLLTSQQIDNFYQLKLNNKLANETVINHCVQQIMTIEFASIKE